ncbi:MAG: tetratricopeptide repeat protein [Planctomycetaceae bacterium]|nr:tetratricopeptide repeat protein [Planctomycetaceae bacterium]
MQRRVFISAVSDELKSYRVLVDQKLRLRGYEPVVQEIFDLTDQAILDKLRDKISGCEAVICLIGAAYGAEPMQPPAGAPRRSFTQWEFFLAQELKKNVYRLVATDAAPVDHPNAESDELRALQQTFRADVTGDRDWRSFANQAELRAEIAELRFPWEPARAGDSKPQNLPASLGTLFKGRDEFLKTLHERLTAAAGHVAAITPRHAIHGLGGVGKTQLAVEYGWRYRDDYTALLYVFADSPQALLANLARLTGVLQISGLDQQGDPERAQGVLDWLREHPGWYLVIDNVDTREAVQGVTATLDRLVGGHVVITSRIAQWPDLVEPLGLDVLVPDDGVAYLLEAARQRDRAADDVDQARALVGLLDGLALALTQSAAYINRYKIGFAEYRRRWQSGAERVQSWHDAKAMTYPRSVAVTWNTSVEQLSAGGRRLLELLAWLAPEPIPREFLTGMKSANPLDEAGVDAPEEMLAELADLSLVKLTANSVEVHRLVQEITRNQVAADERAGRVKVLLALFDVNELGNPTDLQTWPRWEPLAPHLAALVEHADALEVAEGTARWMNGLGLYLAERIRLVEAERLYRRALAIDEQSYGPNHSDVARDLNNLATLLQATNRLGEAEPLMHRVVTIVEKSLGQDHPNVATALNNLAQLLQATNRLGEAEPLMRRALAIDEQSHGPDHPKVARDLINLAALLQDTNRLGEAEPLMRRALVIDEQSYGPDHPDVARALNNLAQLLQATNRLGEAEPLMRRALAINEQSYGPDHPDVARALNNLAQLLQATNRLGEAEPLMRRHLEIFLQFTTATGHEHPHLRDAVANYTALLEEMGRTPHEVEARLAALTRQFGTGDSGE